MAILGIIFAVFVGAAIVVLLVAMAVLFLAKLAIAAYRRYQPPDATKDANPKAGIHQLRRNQC